MPNNPKLLYWDSCIFLAWLKDESRPGDEMAGLGSIAREIEKKNFSVITSVITIAEILTGRSSEEVVTEFGKLFQRSNFQMINVDERIATKASEIRNHYIEKAKREKGSSIRFADSLHLATAITSRVSRFHTFDGSHEKRGLLDLNGDVAGYPLVIEKPDTAQKEFDFE